MGKKAEIELHFPLGGVDKRGAFRAQPPFSTPDALNVFPFDLVDDRERGGTRPGLAEKWNDLNGMLIQWMGQVSLASEDLTGVSSSQTATCIWKTPTGT
jgi:hypothetical protein